MYCLLVENLRCLEASVNKFDKVQDRLRAARGNWELVEGESEEVGTLQKEHGPFVRRNFGSWHPESFTKISRESPGIPFDCNVTDQFRAVIISIFLQEV